MRAIALVALTTQTASVVEAQAGNDPADREPVTVSAVIIPPSGDTPAVIEVTADIDIGWNIYALDQPAGGPQRSKIRLEDSQAYSLTREFRPLESPETHTLPDVWGELELREHRDQVTWYAPIEFRDSETSEPRTISGVVRVQACQEVCIPLKLPFTARIGETPGRVPVQLLSIPAATVAKADEPSPNTKEATPDKSPVETSDGLESRLRARYDLSLIRFDEPNERIGSASYFLWAFVGGLILNLMPCVLPVVGLKVLSFVRTANRSRAEALSLNLMYALGIVSVFWVLGALAIGVGLSWGEQFSSIPFLVAMCALVFVMALSLLGVWELSTPQAVNDAAASEFANRESATAAYAKGALTTLLATPCTGPGVGIALGWAVRQPPGVVIAVFTTMGLGMATPYVVLGLFPSLLRFVPKPGPWMIRFKEAMGFVLIGTVLFLLSLLPTDKLLPTVIFLSALALACWAYSWLSAAEHGRWLPAAGMASIITGVGAWFAYGWLVPAMTPPENVAWQPFSLERLHAEAVVGGRTVLVDFGADWCANCRVLETTVLRTDDVESRCSDLGVVTLFADNTDYPAEIEETLRALQCNGVPVVAIFPGATPHEPIVFRGIYSKSQILSALADATESRLASNR